MRISTALAGVAVVATLAGCADHPAGPRIEFTEAASAPVHEGAEPDAVVTVRIANRTEQPVTITGVRPVPDAGLLADYLGHSTCRRGCAGEGLWSNPDTRKLVEDGLDGVLPVTLEPGGTTRSFVFRLRVTDPVAVERVARGCWLRVRDVGITLADGAALTASTPAEGDERYVVGLHASPPPPRAPTGCTPYRSQPSTN